MRHFAKMLLLLLAGLPVTVTEAQTLQRDEGISPLQSTGKTVTPTPEGVRIEYHFPAPEFTEAGSEDQRISISGLSAGVYVLGAYDNGTMVETTKIVVR